MTSVERDPITLVTPALRPDERITVRRRLADGSATDVIGWVLHLDDSRIELVLAPQRRISIERAGIIAVRRVPPARGGPDPLRIEAAALQRITLPGWVDQQEPCGDWVLRSADGFSRRANSCLAVGEPGFGWDAAAERVIGFYRRRGLDPLVQVIADDPAERALTERGWQAGGPDTDLLVIRLAQLISGRPVDDEPSPAVVLDETLGGVWLEGLLQQRGLSEPTRASRAVLSGSPPVVFASVNDPDSTSTDADRALVAMARGQISAGWLGVTCVWTRPDRRRRGLADRTIAAIARWAAIRNARYVYLQVAQDNVVAQATYAGLGFARHHGYRYLRPPD